MGAMEIRLSIGMGLQADTVVGDLSGELDWLKAFWLNLLTASK